jgi:hypothetical protein
MSFLFENQIIKNEFILCVWLKSSPVRFAINWSRVRILVQAIAGEITILLFAVFQGYIIARYGATLRMPDRVMIIF